MTDEDFDKKMRSILRENPMPILPMSEVLESGFITRGKLRRAIDAIDELRGIEPMRLIVNPLDYDGIQWEMRRDRVVFTIEVLPGALRARRLIARAKRYKRSWSYWLYVQRPTKPHWRQDLAAWIEERPRWR